LGFDPALAGPDTPADPDAPFDYLDCYCDGEEGCAYCGDTPADSQECSHGITLANKQTGVERCAECGALVRADSQEDKT
jgi:hypothetical protein